MSLLICEKLTISINFNRGICCCGHKVGLWSRRVVQNGMKKMGLSAKVQTLELIF
jgi:hypothetical protein